MSGVFDFQFASQGSRLFDLVRVEADFAGRHPREAYSNPEYRKAFREGYESMGQAYEEDARQRTLRTIIDRTRGVHTWWVWGRILPANTPEKLDDLLTALSTLA